MRCQVICFGKYTSNSKVVVLTALNELGKGLEERGIGLTLYIFPAQREETEENHEHFQY
jgi:hypothetical protein